MTTREREWQIFKTEPHKLAVTHTPDFIHQLRVVDHLGQAIEKSKISLLNITIALSNKGPKIRRANRVPMKRNSAPHAVVEHV